jgi:hypothetical protein
MPELFKDPAWLKEQYVDKNRSQEDIAKECQTDAYEVNFYLEVFDITRDNRSENFFS